MSNQERKLAAIVYTDTAGFSEISASDENLAIELNEGSKLQIYDVGVVS